MTPIRHALREGAGLAGLKPQALLQSEEARVSLQFVKHRLHNDPVCRLKRKRTIVNCPFKPLEGCAQVTEACIHHGHWCRSHMTRAPSFQQLGVYAEGFFSLAGSGKNVAQQRE